jgi:hypothetical protein
MATINDTAASASRRVPKVKPRLAATFVKRTAWRNVCARSSIRFLTCRSEGNPAQS